jgi:uncharacterized membrane protein
LNAAKWMFWLGILMALFTVATGLLAYFTIPNMDADARSAINKHLISAILTATTYLILAFFLWRRQRQQLPPSDGWTTALVLAIALLAYTGYLGGDLVFGRGVGIRPATVVPTAAAFSPEAMRKELWHLKVEDNNPL